MGKNNRVVDCFCGFDSSENFHSDTWARRTRLSSSDLSGTRASSSIFTIEPVDMVCEVVRVLESVCRVSELIPISRVKLRFSIRRVITNGLVSEASHEPPPAPREIRNTSGLPELFLKGGVALRRSIFSPDFQGELLGGSLCLE